MCYVFKRLDRAWYDLDSGYDETNNPFAGVAEEYTKKKEEQLAKQSVKRMSAQQRQINKVQCIFHHHNLNMWLAISDIIIITTTDHDYWR